MQIYTKIPHFFQKINKVVAIVVYWIVANCCYHMFPRRVTAIDRSAYVAIIVSKNHLFSNNFHIFIKNYCVIQKKSVTLQPFGDIVYFNEQILPKKNTELIQYKT